MTASKLGHHLVKIAREHQIPPNPDYDDDLQYARRGAPAEDRKRLPTKARCDFLRDLGKQLVTRSGHLIERDAYSHTHYYIPLHEGTMSRCSFFSSSAAWRMSSILLLRRQLLTPCVPSLPIVSLQAGFTTTLAISVLWLVLTIFISDLDFSHERLSTCAGPHCVVFPFCVFEVPCEFLFQHVLEGTRNSSLCIYGT